MTELGFLDHFFAKRTLKKDFSDEKALFLATLMHTSRQGHLCWKNGEAPSLPLTMIQEGKDLHPSTPVVQQGDRYYLQRNWVYETYLLEQVKRLRSQIVPPSYNEEIFRRELAQAKLSPLQRKAIEGCGSFSLICGGPGTGKTYTAGILVRLLLASSTKKKYKVILSAPTGKAASHLGSALQAPQIEVTTLHRLLRLKPGESRLFSNRKIDADLVIVDEASMIDVPLLAQLLEAIGSETRLVLMGDPDQLPPVEAGSLFAEMAALFGSPLSGSMRTDKADLHALAEGINRGEFDGEKLLPWAFDAALVEKIYQEANPLLSWEEPDPLACLKKLNDFRILGALRQGPFGTDALNRQIVREMGNRIRQGQWWVIPIMITSNEARMDLYNGSCGVLIGQSRSGLHLRDGVAYFPEKVLFKDLPPFEVAFCLSIHKSQGSEFERVLALFPQGSENFGRESLYTAVTRAKNRVEIAADEATLRVMLGKRSQRTSGFTERFS